VLFESDPKGLAAHEKTPTKRLNVRRLLELALKKPRGQKQGSGKHIRFALTVRIDW
jgi:hypothetical protein